MYLIIIFSQGLRLRSFAECMIFMYLLIIFSQDPRLRTLLACMILMLFLFQYIVRSQTAGEPV
jgi:hypothetical protein